MGKFGGCVDELPVLDVAQVIMVLSLCTGSIHQVIEVHIELVSLFIFFLTHTKASHSQCYVAVRQISCIVSDVQWELTGSDTITRSGGVSREPSAAA